MLPGFAVAAKGVGAIKDENQVGTDFRNFLLSFIEIFPEYKGEQIAAAAGVCM